MKKIVFFFILAGLLFGCATSVPVEIMKPGKVNMQGTRNIAILNFGYPALGYSDATVDVAIRNSINRYLGYGHLRNSAEEQIANYATDNLINLLMKTDYFNIVEANAVQSAIIQANKINLSVQELGEITGADAIITGSIMYMDTDITSTYKNVKDPKTKKVYRNYIYTKKATLSLSYRIVNSKNSQLITSQTLKGEDTDTADSSYELEDSNDMYRNILNKIMADLPKQLAPYTQKEYRYLMSDETKDPMMKEYDDLVRKKFYSKAYDGFLSVWQKSGNVAAGYNAAIMLEITGDIDGAITLMTEVADKATNEKALREVGRLESTKREMEKAAEQM